MWRASSLTSPAMALADGAFWAGVLPGWTVTPDGRRQMSDLALPAEANRAGALAFLQPLGPSEFLLVSALEPEESLHMWRGPREALSAFPDHRRTDVRGWRVAGDVTWILLADPDAPDMTRFVAYRAGAVVSNVALAGVVTTVLPSADGSLLMVELGEPANVLRLMADGTVAWRVPLVDEDGSRLTGADTAPLMDHAGVLYIASGTGRVVAVQTDALPPPDGTCWIDGCNARRDHAMVFPEPH